MAKKSEHHKANKARSSGKDRAPKSNRGAGSGGELSGYRQKMRGIRMGQGGKSKSGCFPKLFTLFLSFIIAGAYLFLRS